MDENTRLKRLSDLAPSVAHDIKNILGVVSGYVGLLELESNKNSKDSLSYIAGIRTEIERISNLTKDILDMSSAELKLHRELIYVDEFMANIKKDIQFLKDDKKIKIDFIIEHSIEIIGDRDRLFRVFINLIKNSIDAIDKKGKIVIKVKRVGNETSFLIYDTGKGISPAHQLKIFDMYYTSKKLGTGLGLAIAKEIILAHNGKIFFKSTVGRYTCFVVRLPLYE